MARCVVPDCPKIAGAKYVAYSSLAYSRANEAPDTDNI